MSIEAITHIIHNPNDKQWSERNKAAFEGLFGSPAGRYPQSAKNTVSIRAPEMRDESSVPFCAYIHPSNPPSGPYGGFSFVIFPIDDGTCVIGLGVGTQGLSPDEAVLGRPGHARKAQAIAAWLNGQYGKGEQVAWAKSDPTRTDVNIPGSLERKWPACQKLFKRYGNVMYLLFRPTSDRQVTSKALCAILDLTFEERGSEPLQAHHDDSEEIRSEWFHYVMPKLERSSVKQLLAERRFVIIQGPPAQGRRRWRLNC